MITVQEQIKSHESPQVLAEPAAQLLPPPMSLAPMPGRWSPQAECKLRGEKQALGIVDSYGGQAVGFAKWTRYKSSSSASEHGYEMVIMVVLNFEYAFHPLAWLPQDLIEKTGNRRSTRLT